MKERYTVLIVDDVPQNIHPLMESLKDEHAILAATSGEKALELADKADIILLDVIMEGLDGYQVCERLKSNPKTAEIPVIFITALTDERDEAHGLEIGAVDYIFKPINPEIVRQRVRNHIELKQHRDHLEELVDKKTVEVKKAKEAIVEAMGIVAENYDPETGAHISRTKNYVKLLAESLVERGHFVEELTPEIIEKMHVCAPLHDIGKVAIDAAVLMKPGKLDNREWAVMKTHAKIGEDTIRMAQERLGEKVLLDTARQIAGAHHEKWDGTGYPRGLKGESIPLAGRIMAVADVYDALISKRCYKPPFTHSKAVELIGEGKGKHFDPLIVDVFLEIHESFRQIALEFSDEELCQTSLKQ